jgi:serralysin
MSTISASSASLLAQAKATGTAKPAAPIVAALVAPERSASNTASVVVTLSSAAVSKAASVSAASASTPVDAATAISTYTAAKSKTSVAAFVISDTADHILSNLDALQTLAAANKITSISFSDGTPKWTIAAAKFKTDASILGKLTAAIDTVSFTKAASSYKVKAGTAGGVTITGGTGTEPTSLTVTPKFLKFSDTTVIAGSGNSNVNALLNIGTNMWWKTANAASTGTSAITAGLNSLTTDSSKHALTYSFMGATKPTGLSKTDANGYTPMTDPQKAAVKAAFAYLSTFLNVSFTEATDSSAVDISFGQNTQASSAGYAYPPNGNGSNPTSYLFLAKNATSNPQGASSTAYLPGTYGWETIIHEIGHTLGLKHPGNYNAGGGGASGPYLPTATDTRRYSTMSYNDPADSRVVTASGSQTAKGYSYSYSQTSVNPSTYGVYDMAALQFLYGANTSSTTSDISATDSYADFQTVWSPNGVKVDASATTNADIFDLRAGSFSSISVKSKALETAAIKTQLVSSGLSDTNAGAAASAIMKKISPSTANPLYGGLNNLALSYGSQYSEVDGGSGNDSIYASTYSAKIDGGGGSNTVWLAGSASDWTLTGLTSATSKSDPNVTLTLSNIQTIAYYNPITTAITHTA